MDIALFQVDAFTREPFAGNPAAVCLLSAPHDETWMLNVAREMNLSETAFLLPQADGYNLRWFTPAVEVRLCGHATLASAHVLWETGALPPSAQIRFHTQSGLLTADRDGDWIELDFPATLGETAEVPTEIAHALGVNPRYMCKSGNRYLLELDSEAQVRGVAPDFTALKALPGRGVVITSRAADPAFDFVSRYFAPWVGINEDPVTGSAHCSLAPYWSQRLGKTQFTARQVSARGGVLRVRLAGERVRIAGQAVTVWHGALHA